MSVRAPRRRRLHSTGQVIVEFALVFLAFITIFMGVIEFGVAYSVQMQLGFASRDAAALASESGSTPSSADGAIMNQIDKDVMAPAIKSQILYVDIFKADANGGEAAIQRYTPGGALFPGWGGWSNAMNNYPASSRCAFIGGIGCPGGSTNPDKIGVKIVYQYNWITPLPSLITLGGTGVTLTLTSLVQMEPIPAV
jgi:hypothetical protein